MAAPAASLEFRLSGRKTMAFSSLSKLAVLFLASFLLLSPAEAFAKGGRGGGGRGFGGGRSSGRSSGGWGFGGGSSGSKSSGASSHATAPAHGGGLIGSSSGATAAAPASRGLTGDSASGASLYSSGYSHRPASTFGYSRGLFWGLRSWRFWMYGVFIAVILALGAMMLNNAGSSSQTVQPSMEEAASFGGLPDSQPNNEKNSRFS
jgi:hypothetical protein